MERAESIIALTKELLGPRNGAQETLINEHDPRNEFITGILIPRNSSQDRDIDSEAEIILTGDDFGDEGEGEQEDNVVVTGFSPALDPKSLPKSLGISFVAKVSNPLHQLQILFTWARYRNNNGNWVRSLEYKNVELSFPLSDDQECSGEQNGAEFKIRTTQLDNDTYKISIFMVNNTTLIDPSSFNTEDCIFQPQIRIKCIDNIEVTPFDSIPLNEEIDFNNPLVKEDMSLKLLYRNKPALARGHLVGVTWKEVDPQRKHKYKEVPKEQPFYWIDGELLPKSLRERFSTCDLRTDYLPMYPVVAPDMSWRPEFGPPPEFHPSILAESYEAEEVSNNLLPLKNGYKMWVQKQMDEYGKLGDGFKSIGKIHLNGLEDSFKRIEAGIDLLINNEEARLAFCFMNKVIATQQSWARRRKETKVFPWRPFQLAFILQNITSIFDEEDPYRNKVDLLFFATGGGKTESYLGLGVFTMALLRLRAKKDRNGHRKGTGVNILSRYTLRLLTIQQYRRALRVITACEFLRVHGQKEHSPIGWRPKNCSLNDDFLWGTERFSIGLFVGGGVTPNSIHSLKFRDEDGVFQYIPGAIDLLKQGGNKSYGEPAQVLNCPCCNSHLAIPSEGLGIGDHTLHFIFEGTNIRIPNKDSIQFQGSEEIISLNVKTQENSNFHTLSISFRVSEEKVKAETITNLWNEQIKNVIGDDISLLSASPIRAGYFIKTFLNSVNKLNDCGFEIFCPNPKCELNSVHWSEKVPVNISSQTASEGDMEYQDISDGFKVPGQSNVSYRVPIPAYTVDDQIYHRCPTMIIATVDKFAQLPSEPRAASIFGNVEYYHARWGYYRENCPPADGSSNLSKQLKGHPAGYKRKPLHKKVEAFDPPSLIIQDEMHLVEGPLGSMYGIYEIAIDELSTKYKENKVIKPKYVVSTATVSQAQTQIQALFGREFIEFPSPGLNIEDNFFSHTPSVVHPLDSEGPGRVYVGVCAPGKGAQTPLVRIWSNQLQSAKNLLDNGFSEEEVDGFWTVVGYFNAVRELAGAATLYRQDIPERMEYMSGSNVRELSSEYMELSSRKDSMELPTLLDQLEISLQTSTPVNAALATSMFGTGVDVDRLRSMIINGQPKSTSSYIQASGRVGRSKGGLVISFFRASRPRDLDHYEHFTGYHHSLYKHVEPITVAPFSPRARERAIGPLCVALLRNARMIGGEIVNEKWRVQQRLEKKQFVTGATHMSIGRHSVEVEKIIKLIEDRVGLQPNGRRPQKDQVLKEIRSELDRWKALSQKYEDLLYKEPSMASKPTHAVVLGDLQHFFHKLDMAFKNAPSSLRDVEGTTTFKGY